MDEAVVHSCLLRQPPRGHSTMALRDQQRLGGVEDRGDSLGASSCPRRYCGVRSRPALVRSMDRLCT